MKKILCLIVTFVMFVCCFTVFSSVSGVSLKLDGEPIPFEQPPDN